MNISYKSRKLWTYIIIYIVACIAFVYLDKVGILSYDSNFSILWWLGYILVTPLRLIYSLIS